MINRRIQKNKIEIGKSIAPQANNRQAYQARCLLHNLKGQEKSPSRSKTSTNRTTRKIDQSKHGKIKKKTKKITTKNVKSREILKILIINSNSMKKIITRNIRTIKRMIITKTKTSIMKNRETKRKE